MQPTQKCPARGSLGQRPAESDTHPFTYEEHPRCMDSPDEDAAVAEVVDRLAAKHPDIARERIASIVDDVHAHFQGASVTDFIPVLVEHDVKEQLREIERDGEQTAP